MQGKMPQIVQQSSEVCLEADAPPHAAGGLSSLDSRAPVERTCCVAVLCPQEVSRKLWHMSAGLIPFICPWLPYYDQAAEHWGPNGVRAMVLGTAFVLMVLSYWHSKKFARPGERSVGLAMGCYVGCVVAVMAAFPGHLELGMTVLAVLSIGDGAAGLIGMTLKGRRLPWNSEKTVAGTLGFILFGAPVASGAYWVNSFPKVPWTTALAVGAVTCIVAALAESWRSRINDNLRVGIAGASVVVLFNWLFVSL